MTPRALQKSGPQEGLDVGARQPLGPQRLGQVVGDGGDRRRADASARAPSSGWSSASRVPSTARAGHSSGSVPRLSASSPARRSAPTASPGRPASSWATPRKSRPLATCRGAPECSARSTAARAAVTASSGCCSEQGHLRAHPAHAGPAAATTRSGPRTRRRPRPAGLAAPGASPSPTASAASPSSASKPASPSPVARQPARARRSPAQPRAGRAGGARWPPWRWPATRQHPALGGRRRRAPAGRGSPARSVRPAEARHTPSSQPAAEASAASPSATAASTAALSGATPAPDGRGTPPARRRRAAPPGRPPRRLLCGWSGPPLWMVGARGYRGSAPPR